nr:MAG TPA: hypothetical protein [Caudoviricetes sp.]
MYKILILFVLVINMCSVCLANPIHDMQDNIPTDKALHFMAGYVIQDQLQRNAGCSAFEAFLITSGIAWAKEKWIDDHIDNNDAYATMAGSLFYQVNF